MRRCLVLCLSHHNVLVVKNISLPIRRCPWCPWRPPYYGSSCQFLWETWQFLWHLNGRLNSLFFVSVQALDRGILDYIPLLLGIGTPSFFFGKTKQFKFELSWLFIRQNFYDKIVETWNRKCKRKTQCNTKNMNWVHAQFSLDGQLTIMVPATKNLALVNDQWTGCCCKKYRSKLIFFMTTRFRFYLHHYIFLVFICTCYS